MSRWLQTTATLARSRILGAAAGRHPRRSGRAWTSPSVRRLCDRDRRRPRSGDGAGRTHRRPAHSLNALDRAQLRLGGAMGRIAPASSSPSPAPDTFDGRPHDRRRARPPVHAHRRQAAPRQPSTEHQPARRSVPRRRRADRHLEQARALLRRDDVDYVSIKVGHRSPADLDVGLRRDGRLRPGTSSRCTPGGRRAAGTKFINLDMEEYRDLNLTVEVFTRLLSHPEPAQLRGRDRAAGLPARRAPGQ